MLTTKIALFSVLVALISADCGMPAITPDVSSKIVGGKNAKPGSWPWQGVFKYRQYYHTMKQYKYEFICGGSLIAPGWFMTAAHCVHDDLTARNYQVVMGVYNRSSVSSNQQKLQVQQIYEYSKYNNITHAFDIALIKLATNATLSAQVSTICIPQSDYFTFTWMKNVWVTGWGLTSGKTTWHSGDSGGPAVQQASNGKWYQYGIVSFGIGCARKGYPGVYSRVTDFC